MSFFLTLVVIESLIFFYIFYTKNHQRKIKYCFCTKDLVVQCFGISKYSLSICFYYRKTGIYDFLCAGGL